MNEPENIVIRAAFTPITVPRAWVNGIERACCYDPETGGYVVSSFDDVELTFKDEPFSSKTGEEKSE